jgi:hypothetical protein
MLGASLVRWSGGALVLGGVLNAIFLLVSAGHITGAEHAVSAEWMLAHTAHFCSALLLLPGVMGLYVRQVEQGGTFGAVAFVLALLGTGLYAGTGFVTAWIWPELGASAPAMVEASGPFFTPTLPIFPIAFVTFSLGWLLLGVVTARAAVLPRWAGIALAAGALLQGLPPRPIGPTPWAVIDAGGVLFALGTAWLGFTLWGQTQERMIERG